MDSTDIMSVEELDQMHGMEVIMNNNYILLDGVIRQWLDLMRRGNSLQENQFRYWLDYSRNTLSMISNNPFLMTNYMNVIVAALRPGLQTYQRLSMCLRYLIGIQSVV